MADPTNRYASNPFSKRYIPSGSSFSAVRGSFSGIKFEAEPEE